MNIDIDNIVSEQMSRCSETIPKRLLSSVRSIYSSDDNGLPVHVGSCVLVELLNVKYIITAAHVIDHNSESTLYISGEKTLIAINGPAWVTIAKEKSRENDNIDFSAIEINKVMEEQLGNVVFLNEKTIFSGDGSKEFYCITLGYPNSKNKVKRNESANIKMTPFVYSSLINNDESLFEILGVSKNDHFLLDFNHKKSRNNKKQIITPTCPRGVSGGGLFLIENFIDMCMDPKLEPSLMLMGILTAYKKNQKVLLYTRISSIKRALKSVS